MYLDFFFLFRHRLSDHIHWLLALSVLLISFPAMAEQQATSVYYRHLLFQKSMGNYTGVLSQIMKDEKLQRFGDSRIEAMLLKARFYLDKGLHQEASKWFNQVVEDSSATDRHKNEARFYLGKSYYHQGMFSQSLSLLEQVEEPIGKEVRAELQHLQSMILMQRGDYKIAAEYLQKNWWNAPNNWDLYARMNLGVALIQSGNGKDGLALIMEIGDKNIQTEEAKALVDKANQSLGYLYLKQGKPETARNFLEKVRLQGPYSNMALLGAGWASARLQQYNQAVIPWLELQKKDIRNIPAQEAMLTVPYAFEQMGLHKKSVRYYQKAVTSYEQELANLEKSINGLKQGAAQSELTLLKTDTEKNWLRSVDQASSGIALRYIKQFILDAEFFNLIQNYREARILKKNAEVKINKINDIYNRLLKQAGHNDESASHSNRDQIRFVELLTAELLKRSYQLEQDAQSNIEKINQKIVRRATHLLLQRKKKLDVYLVQSRLALAQSYDRLQKVQ